MTPPLLRDISQKVHSNCFCTRCAKRGCVLRIDGAPQPFALIDMDCSEIPTRWNRSKKCDFVFLGGDSELLVAPIECKNGAPKSNTIVPQLREGAKVANELAPVGGATRFRPIAVFNGQLKRIERDRFLENRNRIKFRSKKIPIKLIRSGSDISKAV